MAKTVYITSGSTWFVPMDFNSSNNTIECWGAGGGGALVGGGGGGGAYSKATNVSLTNGLSVPISIGAGGAAGTSSNPVGQTGGDTHINFKYILIAKGGQGGQATGTILGGQASACYPQLGAQSGGNGGANYSIYGGGGGGGGGNYGAGAAGGAAGAYGGGGGGGANSGNAGSAGSSSTSGTGGNGGAGGPIGPNGGTAGVGASASSAATAGGGGGFGGGGGGGGWYSSASYRNGAAGGAGADSGGGGGGGANTGAGGAGGIYGGGGGGGYSGNGGNGGYGRITVIWSGAGSSIALTGTPGVVNVWTVPAGWNSSSNTIDAVGGGGAGGGGGTNLNQGGGGGAFARATNVSLTPGQKVYYVIGAGGTAGGAGGDTYMYTVSALAKGGKGWGNGLTGQGGQASECVGSVAYSGGNGGNGGTGPGVGGGGGGGGAGASGAGTSGGTSGGNTGGNGGTGGAPSGGGGGQGGVNSSGGGAGANSTVSGGYGAGGGGGGGYSYSDSYGNYSYPAGAAGKYGGGGGGTGFGNYGGDAGAGAQGLIKITYEPAAQSGYLRTVMYKTAGSYQFTVPSNVSAVQIEAYGAGGGGGWYQNGDSRGGTTGGTTTVTMPDGTVVGATGGSGGSVGVSYGAPSAGGSGYGPVNTSVATGGVGNWGARGGITGGAGAGTIGGAGGVGSSIGGVTSSPVAPGGGGSGYGGNTNAGTQRYASGGGGGGFASFTLTAAAGQTLNITVGAGGTQSAYYPTFNGADGGVVIYYAVQPTIVPTGYDVVPGKPTGPVGMDSLASAFMGYGDIQAGTPYGLGSWYPTNITAFNYVSVGGAVNTSARTLNYGYGLQTAPNYTQSVPASGPISLGSFRGTYQQMSMRTPVLIKAANNFEPPFQTYAQYDIVQYAYTGQPQTFQFFNARVIKIECWGASGGTYNGAYTPGGYSVGVYVAPAGGELYVYVGGAGTAGNLVAYSWQLGGWNGGGNGFQVPYTMGGGGGATDVRTNYISSVPAPTASGTIPAYWTQAATLTSLASRIIVAGGGGGGLLSANNTFPSWGAGVGGGTTGAYPTYNSTTATPGTQSNGGNTVAGDNINGPNGGFGYGGGSIGVIQSGPYTGYYSTISGGGGGWYGGGGGLGGAGGSGYVGGLLPNTSSGSLNFGVTTYNVQYGEAGYVANGLAPNGLVNITILG